MTGHGEKLSRLKEQAIAALLACGTLPAAAAQAGVGEKTLRRWLALPDFQAAYRQARQRLFQDAVDRLAHLARQAVDTLGQHLKAEKPADAIRAALGILDHGRQALELSEVVERIEELEAALRQQQGELS